MTWKTSQGERVLSEKETKLFCSCIATMIDMARDSIFSKKLNYGDPLIVGAFEHLSDPQKYSVLEEVTIALTQPTDTCPELTAINESAIYYVYAWLKQQFDDVEMGEDIWGEQILEVYKHDEEEDDGDDEEYDFILKMGCMKTDAWEYGIDSVADRILWDRDFEMEAQFGAMGGGAAQGLMQMMAIDQGYF